MILRFFSSLFTRFAKTFGVLFILAGFGVASFFAVTATERQESVRYRPSEPLSEQLSNLSAHYDQAKHILLKLRGKAEFPQEYQAANAAPQFLQTYVTEGDFAHLRKTLPLVSAGRAAMKGYVTGNIDSLISTLEQKLLAHAQSIHSQSPPETKPSLSQSNTDETLTPHVETIYDRSVSGTSEKASLEQVKDYLETLYEAAESRDSKEKIQTSLEEIDLLENLLPAPPPASPPAPPATVTPPTPEPLAAEKVAAHLENMKGQIWRALLSEWALDRALDSAAATAESEERNCAASELAARQISEGLRLQMAAAITVGLVLGLFFLLIGDWTQKSSTHLLSPPFAQLIKDFTASPKEVYDIIEKHIAKREVPGLEITRQFWHEGSALSAKREYLRLARERLVFEICAAPFGTGFFVSFRSCEIPLAVDPLAIFIVLGVTGAVLLGFIQSCGLMWGGIILVFGVCLSIFFLRMAIARGLANVDRALMKTPLIAPLYEMFLRPDTYYRIDSTAMYVQAVQSATAESFQSIFGERGVNLLSETVPPPVMEAIYRKRSL